MKKLGWWLLLTALFVVAVSGAGAECQHSNLGETTTDKLYYGCLDIEEHSVSWCEFADCLDCGESVLIKQWTEVEPHEWSRGGEGFYCLYCQRFENNVCQNCYVPIKPDGKGKWYSEYYSLCAHEFAVGCTSCHALEPSHHHYNRYYYVPCQQCGEYWLIFNDNSELQPHDFDSDGDCVDCGYHKPCSHTSIKGHSVGEPTYERLNLLRHTKITTMQDICEDCGAQIGKEWKNSITEPHVFVAGICLQCGAVEATDSEYEPLLVNLIPWERVVNQGDTVAVTPQISGGSGQYVVTARAESSDGQVLHGYTTLRGNSANIWVFYVTVEDTITGEIMRAESPRIVVLGNCRHAETKPVEPRVETVYKSTGEAKRHAVYRQTTPIDQCDHCHQLVEREPVLELKAVEKHSFKQGVCEDCGQLSKEAAAERYSIYIDGSEYYPALDTVVLEAHLFGLQLKAYDAQEDKAIKVQENPELTFVITQGHDFVEMSDEYRIKLKRDYAGGIAFVELQYCGEMVDRVFVRDSHLWENGDYVTPFVLLETLEAHDWDDHGVWISNHLEMFDLDVDRFDTDATSLLNAVMASDKAADFYRLKFDIVNWGASVYAVSSYYADETEYERVYVKSHWEEFNITNTLKYAWEGLEDYFDGKIGNSEMGRTRTEIEIMVPAGGFVRFHDSMHEDVRLLNKVNCAARTLALTESYMSIFNFLEVKDKKAVADALVEADWDEIAVELVQHILKTDGKILELSVDALVSNPTFWRCLRDVLVNVVIGECVNKAEQTALMAVDPTLYLLQSSGDAVIQTIQRDFMLKVIEDGENGKNHIDLNIILMPQK